MKEQLKNWQLPDNQWMQFKQHGNLFITENVLITQPTLNQVGEISGLLKGEEALIEINEADITSSIDKKLCLVAIDSIANKTIGYQAIGVWEEMKLIELRSAKVNDEYRGQGINTMMKKISIKIAQTQFPGWPLVGFTESASKSRGILTKLGFEELPLERVKEEYNNLSSICPDQCYIKNGHPCGCKVYLLNTHGK